MKTKSFYCSTRQRNQILMTLDSISQKDWSYNHPVFLLDRCWLRLEEICLAQLGERLIYDNSLNSPELVKYNKHIREGTNNLLAVQKCWHEFGMQDFHRALRNHWDWKERGNNGWTFDKYLYLIKYYKTAIEKSNILIPLIILARKDSKENHVLKWVDYNTFRS